jgi:hypothetical protein
MFDRACGWGNPVFKIQDSLQYKRSNLSDAS